MHDADECAIRALERDCDSAWNAGDVDGLVARFTSDAVVVNPLGKRARGQTEIRQVLAQFLGGIARGSRHTSAILGIEFVRVDVAVVDGEATLEDLMNSDGAPSAPLIHRFTDVVVKRDGAWKIVQVRAYVFLTTENL